MKKISISVMLIGLSLLGIGCNKMIENEDLNNKNFTEDIDSKKEENIISEKNISKKEEKINFENDNVFLALKLNGGSSGHEILAKGENDETFKSVDIGPDVFSVTYSDSLDRIFFVDRYGTIRTCTSNDIKDFGHNASSSYRSGAGYRIHDLGVVYKMPKNKNSLAYTTKDGKLFYVDSMGAQQLVGENIGYSISDENEYINNKYFNISENGKYVFYNTMSEMYSSVEHQDLYRYDTVKFERLEIESGVEKFNISPSGEVIIYFTPSENNIYVKNINNNTLREYKSEFPNDMKVFDDGSAVFIESVDESSMTGFVTYIDKEGESHKIPSKVKCHKVIPDLEYARIVDNKIYFLNEQKKLCLYELGSNNVNVIFENVDDFEIINNKIYLGTQSGQLYTINDNGAEKVISNETGEAYKTVRVEKIDDKNIFIKSKDGKAYINDKLISENIERYSIYNGKVAYTTTNDEVYTIDLKTMKVKLEFAGYKELDCLYYGNDILYTNEYIMINER